eukprot:gene20670-27460_t
MGDPWLVSDVSGSGSMFAFIGNKPLEFCQGRSNFGLGSRAPGQR